MMDDEVENETFRRYIADTTGALINLMARLGGQNADYPLFTDIITEAYKPKHPTDYMDSKQIINYICDKLETVGDAHEMEI